LIVGLCITMGGAAYAQQPLTDKDRAEIRQLSDNYVTYLDGCKAAEYAGLFTADGSFISGPRGTMTGREPNTSGGHYEDVYVKTAAGWKFKSRTYLSPKEEASAPASSTPVK